MLSLWEHLEALKMAHDHFTSEVCKKHNLKQSELDIILYLHTYPNYCTARDIVRKENLSKSHVSISLKSLEQKGLVRGEFKGTNRRTIYLNLTDASREIVNDGLEARALFAKAMLENFSEEEKKAFFEYLLKVKKNIIAHSKNRH